MQSKYIGLGIVGLLLIAATGFALAGPMMSSTLKPTSTRPNGMHSQLPSGSDGTALRASMDAMHKQMTQNVNDPSVKKQLDAMHKNCMGDIDNDGQSMMGMHRNANLANPSGPQAGDSS